MDEKQQQPISQVPVSDRICPEKEKAVDEILRRLDREARDR
jgi:hypothetical protein